VHHRKHHRIRPDIMPTMLPRVHPQLLPQGRHEMVQQTSARVYRRCSLKKSERSGHLRNGGSADYGFPKLQLGTLRPRTCSGRRLPDSGAFATAEAARQARQRQPAQQAGSSCHSGSPSAGRGQSALAISIQCLTAVNSPWGNSPWWRRTVFTDLCCLSRAQSLSARQLEPIGIRYTFYGLKY
jgi:hypothetical protein